MIVRLLRTDGRKFTAHTVNSFTELLYIVVGFQELGYLWVAGECVAEASPVKGGRPGPIVPGRPFSVCAGRNREQITVEQKFISDFQQGRLQVLSPMPRQGLDGWLSILIGLMPYPGLCRPSGLGSDRKPRRGGIA